MRGIFTIPVKHEKAEYIATAKNQPARDFLKDNGFLKVSEDGARSEWKQKVQEALAPSLPVFPCSPTTALLF